MGNSPIMFRRAASAGIAVFVVVTLWMVLTADDVRATLASAALIGLPILALALGALWLLSRSRSGRAN